MRASPLVAAFLALCCAGTPRASLAAGPLDAQERAGRRIYVDALSPSGEPLRALVGVGQTPLAGTAVACGNCHGADGKGRPEGGVLPSDVTWEELTRPYGHDHSTRKHGAFTASNLAPAVNEGLDPSGNRLDWAMPRYALSRSEVAALVAYLKRLHAESDPGIGERVLRIGTILPTSGPLAPAGKAVRDALKAYFDTVNRAGGIHQRRLELIVAPDVKTAGKRFSAEPVFALVSPFASGEEDAFESLVDESKLPAMLPFASSGQHRARHSALVFTVYSGLPEQAEVLVEFAAREAKGSGWRAAIVSSGTPAFHEAAEAASRRCEKRGCGDVVRVGSYVGPLNAPAAVERLKAEGRRQIFFFGAEEEFGRLLDEAGRASDSTWRPKIYSPGSLARSALAAPERFDGELYLVYPTAPSERAGGDPLDELRKNFKLVAHHEAAQKAALASASVLAEGLRRAGRDLSRARLVRALEGLNRFDPGGFAPPVSFGPDRRCGALGGYVVGFERERGIVPVSGWIALD
jgi:ABC-type branched-subunit amino acid transport system substrate-binding protein